MTWVSLAANGLAAAWMDDALGPFLEDYQPAKQRGAWAVAVFRLAGTSKQVGRSLARIADFAYASGAGLVFAARWSPSGWRRWQKVEPIA